MSETWRTPNFDESAGEQSGQPADSANSSGGYANPYPGQGSYPGAGYDGGAGVPGVGAAGAAGAGYPGATPDYSGAAPGYPGAGGSATSGAGSYPGATPGYPGGYPGAAGYPGAGSYPSGGAYPGAGYGQSNGAANFYVYKPGIIPLRPLSIGDIYQGAFAAIKTNARTMFGFTAALLGVVLVISIATNYAIINLVLPNYLSPSSPYAAVFTSLSGSFSQLGGSLLQVLATVLLSGLIVVAVSRSVLGRVASSKEVWERTKSKFLPLIGLNIITSIISGLMMIIGIVVFFVLLASVASTAKTETELWQGMGIALFFEPS